MYASIYIHMLGSQKYNYVPRYYFICKNGPFLFVYLSSTGHWYALFMYYYLILRSAWPISEKNCISSLHLLCPLCPNFSKSLMRYLNEQKNTTIKTLTKRKTARSIIQAKWTWFYGHPKFIRCLLIIRYQKESV